MLRPAIRASSRYRAVCWLVAACSTPWAPPAQARATCTGKVDIVELEPTQYTVVIGIRNRCHVPVTVDVAYAKLKNRTDRMIGYSGNSGYSATPHLHFDVSMPGACEGQTLPIRFAEATIPTKGRRYGPAGARG